MSTNTEVLAFIRNNYTTHGSKYCYETLKISRLKFYRICEGNDIAIDIEDTNRPIDLNRIYHVSEPIVAYYLGLLWADGYVDDKIKRVVLNVNKLDGLEYYNLLKVLGHFSLHTIPASGTTKEVLMICLYNKVLAQYLQSLDYRDKSIVSPTKVLSTIPNHLKRYFWLGFYDGDGGMSFREKNNVSMYFCGSRYQDWSDLEKFILYLKCEASITLNDTNSLGHQNSILYIYKQMDMLKICKVFYENYDKTKIALPRKYNLFLKLENNIISSNQSTAKSGYRGVSSKGKKYTYTFKLKENHFYGSGFNTALEAAIAYDKKSIELLGHRARTNFPLENYIDSISTAEI